MWWTKNHWETVAKLIKLIKETWRISCKLVTGQFSISLNMSNKTTCPSVLLLSSLMCVITSLMVARAFSNSTLSGLVLGVCLRRSFKRRLIDGRRCTGRMSSSCRLWRRHFGLLCPSLRKAWNRGFDLSLNPSTSFVCSKKFTKGG